MIDENTQLNRLPATACSLRITVRLEDGSVWAANAEPIAEIVAERRVGISGYWYEDEEKDPNFIKPTVGEETKNILSEWEHHGVSLSDIDVLGLHWDEWSFQMIKDPCPPYQEWFMAASDSDFGID